MSKKDIKKTDEEAKEKVKKVTKKSSTAQILIEDKPKKRGRPKKVEISEKEEKVTVQKKATKATSKRQAPKTTKNTKSKSTTSSSKKTSSPKSKQKRSSKKSNKKTIKSYKTITLQSQFLKNNIDILEYFDLPYRYNETTVKILAQTPKILFVYWDISDYDKEQYKLNYGENFFNDTYPVLLVKNETFGYTTEVPVNDFANSWYLDVPDAYSKYSVELGRKYKNIKKEESPYIYIKSSNKIIAPNDHVLFEKLKPVIKYKNAKTNEITFKNVSNVIKDGEILDFYSLYQLIYNVEDLNSFFLPNNPSSGNPTSTFK